MTASVREEAPPSYYQLLQTLANDDERFASLANRFKQEHHSFDRQSVRRDASDFCKSAIILLDLQDSQLVTRLSTYTMDDGSPVDMSIEDLNIGIDQLISKPHSGGRILIFKYDWWYGPIGLNYGLLDRLCYDYQADPDLLLPHFDLELSPTANLPSQHRVLSLIKQRTTYSDPQEGPNVISHSYKPIICTAQQCTHRADSNNRLILVMHRDGLSRDRVATIQRDIKIPIYHAFDTIGASGVKTPITTIENDPCIKALQKSWYSDHDAVEQNTLELLLPAVRVFFAAHLSSIEVHRKYISSNNDVTVEGIMDVMDKMDEQLLVLQDMLEVLATFYGRPSKTKPHPIIRDALYVSQMGAATVKMMRDRLTYMSAVASINESRSALANGESVKRLTQLAFIFIPLSFVTSIFGMNVDTLIGNGPRWWTVLVGIAIIYTILGMVLVVIYRKPAVQRIRDLSQNLRQRRHSTNVSSSDD